MFNSHSMNSLRSERVSVYAMVKIENAGQQFTFENWGVYQSSGAYCTNDAGSTGVNCKSSLAPGELQTTDFSTQYDSATYTYGINNIAYNIKLSPQASGLLDANNNIVSSVGACAATNSFPSGYTLIKINCDSAPLPTYDATTYTTGVKTRGVNLSGQEWQSGSYYPTVDDANKIKMIGMTAARFPIDITKLSDASGNIDWTSGDAKKVDDSLKMLMSQGLEEVILDAHNTLVGPQTTGDWTSGRITGDQLLKFWQQAAPRYNDYSNFAIGVVNEPHDISTNPSDAQTEADVLFGIYAPIVQWFSENAITARSFWEPSDYGGVADYANPIWQDFYKKLIALSAYPETMIADGHAYGTNQNGPGGSGYGDCQADGVAHNNLQAVADFLKRENFTGSITEYNGDPSYVNCISYVQTTVEFTNMYARNATTGGFESNYLWAYYLNEGSTDPLDVNKYGSPETDPQIVAMQGYGDLIPGQLGGVPTFAPTYLPTFHPTTPTGQPSSRPTLPTSQPTSWPSSQPSSWPTRAPSAPSSMPSSTPTSTSDSGARINWSIWAPVSIGVLILLGFLYRECREQYEKKGNFFGFFQSSDPKYKRLMTDEIASDERASASQRTEPCCFC